MTLLGQRLSTLRKERGLSGAELAARVGLSRSLISQIERGAASPSIDTLYRIAATLDVPVGVFFNGGPQLADLPATSRVTTSNGLVPRQLPAVIHPEERLRLMLPQSSIVHELLTPLSCRDIQVVWSELGPKEGGLAKPYSHQGTQVVLVIEGELTAIVGDMEYVLGPYSSITLDSSVPHRLTNRGSQPVVIVTIMTPASL